MKDLIKWMIVYYYTVLVVIITVFCMSSCSTTYEVSSKSTRLMCVERRYYERVQYNKEKR
jgi:hypothetical protein